MEGTGHGWDCVGLDLVEKDSCGRWEVVVLVQVPYVGPNLVFSQVRWMVAVTPPLTFQWGIIGLGIVKGLPLDEDGLYGAKICDICPARAGGRVLKVFPHTLYILWEETHRDSQTCGSLGVECFGDEGYFSPGPCLAFPMADGV